MIFLKEMTLTDLPLFTKWLQRPHVARWFEHPQSWLTEIKEQNSSFKWIHHYIAMADSLPIGFCQYYACKDSDEAWEGFSSLDGVYSIDYLIGEENYLKKGFGTEIVCCLLDKIKSERNAKAVLVCPNANNVASRATLLSVGFSLNKETNILCLKLNDD